MATLLVNPPFGAAVDAQPLTLEIIKQGMATIYDENGNLR